MDNYEYLKQAVTLDRKIKLDMDKITAMRATLQGRAISYESDGTKHTPNGNSIENALVKVIDYEIKLDEEINTLINLKKEIEGTINNLNNPNEVEVLTRRYILNEKWEDIAKKMYFDVGWVYKLHRKGLQHLTVHQ